MKLVFTYSVLGLHFSFKVITFLYSDVLLVIFFCHYKTSVLKLVNTS